MQVLEGRLVHSASDLNAYTECVHLTALERAVAEGREARPPRENGTATLLARKGDEHERRHLGRLRSAYGERLVAFEDRPEATVAGYRAAEATSVAAMASGAAVIYQATFFDGTFLGRADFLRRVERPCRRWAWSYEVVDTKLALSPKPYFLVQLCNYSEHVARIGGTPPEEAAVVLGTGEERRYRVEDYAAYYRRLKRAYLASVANGDDAYPLECAHCELCAWRDVCAKQRDGDDHLSLVAGIRRDQIRKLEEAGIGTLAALANGCADARPTHVSTETFANLRAQAGEQHRYRANRRRDGHATHSYTFREPKNEKSGFARLPAPAAGDVFFDMEGDPLYRPDRGLEYLFGAYLPDENEYHPFWGTSPADERAAFEAFVDFVAERRRTYPELHVYHYAPYETTALKRLMGRFGSREDVIDDFLRCEVFVDLYQVVRQSLWISQPSYSIKKVEALYGFARSTHTKGGDDSIVMFESWLDDRNPATLEDIRAYNEDDCRSTHALLGWLVRLRDERNATLTEPIPWRSSPPPSDPATLQTIERSEIERRLLDGLPAPDSLLELRTWSQPRRARWLLGNLLHYHRREQKPQWWEFYERCRNCDDLIEEDRKALGGLRLCADVPPYRVGERDRNLVYTYAFPAQEYELEIGDQPVDPATQKGAGTVVALDETARRVGLKRSSNGDPAALRALVPAKPFDDRAKRTAIEAIARDYLDETLERDHPATFALLLGRLPRFADRALGATVQPATITGELLFAALAALERSYLVVQGPPGSGKTTLGAQAIVSLLESGRRIALAAQTHKALHNLLRTIEETAHARGFTFRGCHKSSASNRGSAYEGGAVAPLVADATSAERFAECALVSATTFGWAGAWQGGALDRSGPFDVLVIDEAGQVSLADALATSLVARNVVLLGDPQQLPQVSQGSHPLGADLSILEHLLAGANTIAPDRGIFLDTSYRMHPDLDRYVSRAFYDGRLHAAPSNANNAVALGQPPRGPSHAPGTNGVSRVESLQGGGLRYFPIEHEGNARRSSEESDRIVDAIAHLIDGGSVTLYDAAARRLAASDVLVVAPYNMQRIALEERLRRRGLDGVRVGTVDKFQGQQAPVVFYSMATSSAELAPRGLEFLLSPNRLCVAVSRAQAISVLVCSPHLLASRATTIEGMRLLSLLCSYVEDVTRSQSRPSLVGG